LPIRELLERFALAFVLTQLVEMPIYAIPLGRRWPLGFFASAITHPIVFLVFPRVFALFATPVIWVPGHTAVTTSFVMRALVYFLLVESFAVIVEAIYLRRLRVSHPLRWSLAANGASAAIGAVLTFVTGWP